MITDFGRILNKSEMKVANVLGIGSVSSEDAATAFLFSPNFTHVFYLNDPYTF